MLSILIFIVSFILIWKSADYFVDSSHTLALKMNLSPMVVGATVVAFGTSAPELFVNVFAALDQESTIIYGNILGSNLANTLLILGAAILLAPIIVKRAGFQQLIANIFFTSTLSIILINQWVNRWVAVAVLVSFFVFYIILVTKSEDNGEEPHKNGRSVWFLLLIFVGSLIGLVVSAKLMIYSLLQTAEFLGLSTIFLSLFAVALGTSLPELVSTIVFVRKGHTDMVIGNVFGSNLFNLMLVLPISWLVFPLQMPVQLNHELFLLIATLGGLLIISLLYKQYQRWLSFILLGLYIGYTCFIYLR